jgi:hypothetical protein
MWERTSARHRCARTPRALLSRGRAWVNSTIDFGDWPPGDYQVRVTFSRMTTNEKDWNEIVYEIRDLSRRTCTSSTERCARRQRLSAQSASGQRDPSFHTRTNAHFK